jgi:hypothetical protein
MILKRSRELVINLGDYESARVGAEVSVDITELEDGVDAYKWADDQLSVALAAEVKYFHEITTKKGSFIHLVEEDNGKKNG